MTLAKYVLTILGLNWNQRFRDKKTKVNICHHILSSSTQLQNRSFHVVERTRTSAKCRKNEKCTCKACKTNVFHRQICKFVTFLLPSSSGLFKLSVSKLGYIDEHFCVRRRRRHSIFLVFRDFRIGFIIRISYSFRWSGLNG